MATRPRPLSPHLQVYRPLYTMVLSILHRATGLALTFGLLLLGWWLLALASGAKAYAALAALLGSPPGFLALAAFVLAFWYHFCAGIRHLVFDTGRGLERASARRSAALVIGAAALLAVISFVAMLRFGARS